MIGVYRFASDTDAPVDLCGVYVIEHQPTGRVYVGQTALNFSHRCRQHHYNATAGKAQHAKSRFGRFVRKYGADGFVFRVVDVLDPALPNEDFHAAEQAWIDRFDAAGPGGFNLHPHAQTPRGTKRSEETRRKMSEARKRVLALNPELAAALRQRLTERNRSPAFVQRNRARFSDPDARLKAGSAARAMWADPEKAAEVRASISAAWSDEMRAAASLRSKERMADPSRRASMSRPVYCITTGTLYPSRNEAARAFGKGGQSLSAHLNGRPHCKSFAGHTFRWATDADKTLKPEKAPLGGARNDGHSTA